MTPGASRTWSGAGAPDATWVVNAALFLISVLITTILLLVADPREVVGVAVIAVATAVEAVGRLTGGTVCRVDLRGAARALLALPGGSTDRCGR